MSISASPSRRLRHRFAVDPLFRRRFVFLILGVFAAAGWGSLIFLSTLFTVKGIELDGGKGIDPVTAKAIVFQTLDQRPSWRPWPSRQIWFMDTVALAERLKLQWYADSVVVETHPLSNIVRLIVKEQTNSLFIKTPTQFLRVDAQGVVREELSAADRLQVLQRMTGRTDLVTSSTESIIELPNLTDTVASGYRLPESLEDIRLWFNLSKLFKQMNVPAKYVRVETGRIVLYGQNDIPVYLDTTQNLSAQIKGLHEYYVAQKAQKLEAPTQFIDARIPGRIYVK